jgi:hypothetical protein
VYKEIRTELSEACGFVTLNNGVCNAIRRFRNMEKIILSIFILLTAIFSQAQSQKVGSKDLKALYIIMSGTFTSEKQSKTAPATSEGQVTPPHPYS